MGHSADLAADVDFGVASKRASLSLAEVIGAHAWERPRSPAIVGEGFHQIDYAGLAGFLGEAIKELASFGISPAARVGLIVPPGQRGALMLLAIASQAQLVPIHPALNSIQFLEEIQRSGVDAVIAPDWLDAPLCGRIDTPGPMILSASLADDLRLRLTAAVAGPLPEAREAVTADSIAFLLRSSGTTGDPKQIAVTHRNLVAMAFKMAAWFDITPADRVPCTLPLYYAAGLKTTLFVPLLIGASVGIPGPGRAYEICDWIETIAPTFLSAPPSPLRGLLDRLIAAPRRPSMPFLRFVICGSAYLPETLRREAEELLGVPVLEFYGLSEAGAMAANPAPPRLRKPGTAGLVPPGELILRGEGGAPVAQGEVGEITLNGPSVTPGYVTGQTRTPFGVETGWLATGDLGRIDEDGYLSIVGRVKEIINRGGEKVTPYEVEKALLRHPAVKEAGVFGVPHPRLGENVAAALVLHPDAVTNAEEIRAALDEHLERYKIPQSIAFVDALPRGATGKILRGELAEQFVNRTREAASPPDRILEHQIMAVWTRLLARSDFGIDDDFFEMGGDSLLAAEMLSEVEALVGQTYPQSGLSTLTIRCMADALTSALPPDEGALTAVREGESGSTPFLYCHGDYLSRGVYALRLADLLSPQTTTFVLNNFPDMPFGKTVERIAERYAMEIFCAMPRSPVIVGGYCNGGLIAWHLAYLLERNGYEVRAVILVDVPSINARPRMRRIGNVLRAAPIPSVVAREVMRALWYQLRGVASLSQSATHFLRRRVFARAAGEQKIAVGPTASRYASVHRDYFKMMSGYIPRAISAAVVCITAARTSEIDNAPVFWEALCSRVSTIKLDGTHHSIVTSDREALAEAINSVFGKPARAMPERASA